MAEMDREDIGYNPEMNYDEATLAQQRKIELEIAGVQPLISDRVNFDVLAKDYAEDTIYLEKIRDLRSKYSCVRKTRGDGNCFYRAFGYAYLEKLLLDRQDLPRFKELAVKSKDELVNLGFPQFTIEDFHETFMEIVTKVEDQCTEEDLLREFNDQGLSDYLVVYLRLIVSGHLQKEADTFINFVEGGRSVKEFCHQEVEPMGKESDHIHIHALTSALEVAVRIEYMDRGENAASAVNHHDFPEGKEPSITLLYRPGHYDVLYT